MSTKPAYEGEARLVRWADSGGAGRTVTLQLDEAGDVHPFKHLPWGTENGQRMAIVCVLVNDDEEPIGPDQAKANAKRHKARTKKGVPERAEPAAPVVKAETRRFNELPRSQQAALKCQDREFKEWLDGYSEDWCLERGLMTRPTSPDGRLKMVLGIASKTELDKFSDVAAEFDKLLASYDYRNQVRA